MFSKRKHSPLLMKGGGFTDAVITSWNKASSIFNPLISEVFRLLPDGILFGSAFFALLSQSYPMAVKSGALTCYARLAPHLSY